MSLFFFANLVLTRATEFAQNEGWLVVYSLDNLSITHQHLFEGPPKPYTVMQAIDLRLRFPLTDQP